MENQIGMRHPSLPDGVRAHEVHGNVGYGTAVNLGVRLYLERDPPPDWLLVVNSDIALPADTAAVLPTLLADAPAHADVVGFPIRTEDGRQGRDSSVLPSSRMNAFITLRGEAAAVARWPRLRYPVGAFFAIRAEAFLRLGGFDPNYWMYYEETDLFCRFLETGGRISWADDASHVVHDGGATTGTSPLMQRELGRAAATYFRRHRGNIGLTWPGVHAVQLLVLAARKGFVDQPADAARALRILYGLIGGLARPDWEPARHSPWRAVSAASRSRIGRLAEPAATEWATSDR
jgi:GT2 family glycosyltransferase